jgi:hypothetical protein
VPLGDALVIVDRPRGSAFGTGQGAFDDAPDNPALAAVQYLHPGVSLEGLRLNGPPLPQLSRCVHVPPSRLAAKGADDVGVRSLVASSRDPRRRGSVRGGMGAGPVGVAPMSL